MGVAVNMMGGGGPVQLAQQQPAPLGVRIITIDSSHYISRPVGLFVEADSTIIAGQDRLWSTIQVHGLYSTQVVDALTDLGELLAAQGMPEVAQKVYTQSGQVFSMMCRCTNSRMR